MDQNEEILKLLSQREEETIDIKQFIFRLLSYWYWFAIAAVIGGGAVMIYNKYAPASYDVTSSLLIKDQNDKGMDLENLFDNLQMKSNVKIQNHIGILTSFSVNYQVIQNLGWYVSWFREMPFGDFSLYGDEPYEVAFDPADENLKHVPVYVIPQDSGKFLIKVDSNVHIKGQDVDVDFEQEGEFGKKFKNKYFSFTLKKKKGFAIDDSDDDYFVFNDLDELTLNYLKKLEVSEVNKDADIISMKVSGQSPDKEITYLNELGNVYIEYGLKEKNRTSENTIRFIDQQLTAIVDTLRLTSTQLTNYRSENKVFNLSEKASLVSQKLVDLDSKKSLAQMQLDYYENLMNYMDNADKMKNVAFPSVVGITDAGLNSLVVKLSELYGRKEALSYSLHEKNPGLQIVDRELEYTKRSLNENLKNLVSNTRQELKTIQQEIDQVNNQLGAYPKTEQELINIQRMYDLNNELYTFLLQKRSEAEITKASNVSDVEVIDPARLATVEQTGPRKMINLLAGLFIALIIPFLFIVGRDYFDETIKGKEDLQKLTSLPVAGSIVHNTYYGDDIPTIQYPRSVIAESLRELRTNLDYLYHENGPMVVGIHSIVSGEGKSFVSLNLASIISMDNRRVVLIGADMRKPTLHHRLGLSSKQGLSTYLIGHDTLEQIISPTKVKNLDFISSGPVPPNPSELLGTKTFGALINELKSKYDVIVIDNSPANLVTDSAIVRRHTHIDLFVIRQGYTNRKLIDFINAQVTEHNKPQKTGIVINDINPKRGYGRYSYQYGGYYRKSYGFYGDGYYAEGDHKKNKRRKKKDDEIS